LNPEPEPEPEPDIVLDPNPDDGGRGPSPEPKTTYHVDEQGRCHAHQSGGSCPPGATCNPPPPRVVPCTPEMLPVAANPEQVTRRADGSCWGEPKIECEDGASCNPPPPRRVRCPEDKPSAASGAESAG